MNKYQNRAGLIVAACIPLLVLPARISEGQWKDPVNLIGSELVIFLMSLTCWHSIVFIQKRPKLKRWHKIVFSLLCCCVFSILFFFTFNPIFKDFPFRTATNPLFIRMLMLSSRGVLMSLILVPAAYYVQKDLENRRVRKEHQALALEKVQIQNRLLENAVLERTKALRYALVSVEKSQKELEHQLYVQSRLLASFNHDIKGPFKFSVIVSQKIALLANENGEQSAISRYARELSSSLQSTFTLIENHLEFTKLPIQQKIERDDKVNLRALLEEKAQLFQGSLQTNKNSLFIDVDHQIHVHSNYNLLGIILHNLIDNANKYTPGGSIKISAAQLNWGYQVSISNEGLSVAEHVTDWVNTQVELTDQAAQTHPDGVHGIGLLLVKEIASILNIRLRMRSDATQTQVTLTFSRSNSLDMPKDAHGSLAAS